MRRKTNAELLSLVSHELRTPLTRLRWTAESLMDPALGSLTDTQKRSVEEMLQNADELSTAVEILLEGATVALHVGETPRTAFSLPYLVSHVIKEHPAMPGVRISRRFALAVPNVSADPKGVETAVRLLLSAVCASSLDGKLIVRIGAAGRLVHCIMCTGKDPGPRFSDAFRGRAGRGIMKTSPIPASHRLRLYVAQNLIRASGGDVRLDKRGGPTALSFSLPQSAA